MTDDHAPLVLAERIDHALVLRINRPDAGNAISHDVAKALRAQVDACANDPTLKALILTGTGERYFCAGGDLKAYATIGSPDELDRIFATIRDTLDAFEALDVPVIASVNGFALGGGAEILMACDMRIAEARARIGFPQARLGILPGWDGAARLRSLVGRGRALQLLVGNPRMTADEAMRAGVIDEVVPDGTSVQRALEIVKGFDGVAPLAMRAAKAVLRAGDAMSPGAFRAFDRETFARLWFTADHKEAEAAFAERRVPTFTGR